MADTKAFVGAADRLEARTALDRLEARGTLRIALKAAGFDAKSVTADQLRVVVERVLPRELEARGVANAEAIAQEIARSIEVHEDTAHAQDSPEVIFDRLVGRS